MVKIDAENNIEKILSKVEPYNQIIGAQKVFICLGLNDCVQRLQEIYQTYPSCKHLTGEDYQKSMQQKNRAVITQYAVEKGVLPYALVKK